MDITSHKNGNVSTTLTIITFIMMGFGLIIGNQIGSTSNKITSLSSASSQQNIQTDVIRTHQESDDNRYDLITEPVPIHNEVCFPVGSFENPINDPYCRTRMFPSSLEDIKSPILDRIKRESSPSNPYIIKTTRNNDVTIDIYGAGCINDRTAPRGIFSTENSEVFLSLFPVRKYKSSNNSVGLVPYDVDYAITWLVSSAEDSRGNARDKLGLVNNDENVCTFTNGKSTYRNENNPMVFDIEVSKKLLMNRIRDALQRTSLSTNVVRRQFDRKDCAVYIHLQSSNPNGPKDTFNLARIPLDRILEPEDVQGICTRPSPTPTVPPSPSPSPTVTPTTEPSPTPGEAACYEECSADTNKSQCGNDPTSTAPIKMKCFEISRDPTININGLCQTDSQECRCLPARCEDPAINCSSREAACNLPTITLAQRPSPTPTITPQPTIAACPFESISFVQECTEWFDKSKGICKQDQYRRYIGKPIVDNQYGLQQNPPQHNLSAPWFSVNDKQKRGPLIYYPGSSEAAQKLFSPQGFSGYYFNINNWNIPRFGQTPPQGYTGYKEGDDARIQIGIDTKHYQFLPKGGKEIRLCAQGCNKEKFDNEVRPDIIDGLTLSCDQVIQYGWTLQKCEQTFDIAVVVDTSTSMINFNDPYYGGRKLDVLKSTLKSFILEKLKEEGADNRVALIQFNVSSQVRSDFTQNITSLMNQVDNGLSVHEGTCIECGLREAQKLINNRIDKSRHPFVIILTDGMPNSNPGGPGPREGYIPGVLRAADELRLVPDITIASIGYGDTKIDPNNLPAGQLYDAIIKPIASNPSWAFSTDTNIARQSGPLPELYSKIQTLMNTCSITSINYSAFVKSKDLNNDGIINSVDVLIMYDNYYKDGKDLREDLNEDGIVNSLDLTLVFEDYGKKVEE